MNQVILIGFIGSDPKSTTFEKSEKTKTTFPMATSEKFGENTVTEWHNIVSWNGLAKIAAKYLKKGSQVAITGRISTRSFDKDGQKKYITEIIASKMQMLDRKPNTEIANTQEGDDQPF